MRRLLILEIIDYGDAGLCEAMIFMIWWWATQVRVKREESKGDLETKLNVVDEEERRLDFFSSL